MTQTFRYEKDEDADAGAVVYRLSGVLGGAPASYEFLEAFRGAIQDAPQRIVFNLSGLEHLYSAGVGIIAATFTIAREAGKSLRLAALPKTVARTLTVIGVLPEVPAFDTEPEALAAEDE